MGIKSWLGENFGGPESICKSLLKVYNTYILQGCSREDALRLSLESRYSIIKTIPESSFDSILIECSDLGQLAYICIIYEQPQHGGDNIIKTMLRIGDFYANYAPEHANGIGDFIARVASYIKFVKAGDYAGRVACGLNDPPLRSLLYKTFSDIDQKLGL